MNKRKYIHRFIGAFIVLLLMGACTDELDKQPDDQLTIDRILSTNSVEGLRDRSYENLNQTFQNFNSGQLLEVYTDDAFRAGTDVAADWHEGRLSPQDNMFASTRWDQYWQGVRKSNLAIKYIPQSTVPDNIISEDNLNRWYDEAKVLRAWYHFMLVRDFGPVPFIEEPFKADFTDWDQLTRPSYDDVISRIVDELDEVIENGRLPYRWQASNDYNKVNMAVAFALKSRVLLYGASSLYNPGNDQQKWEDAADAARNALDSLQSDYQLVSIDDYGTLFNESYENYNDEIILRGGANGAGVMNNLNGVDLSSLGSPTQASNCGAVPTQELVDCFELSDGSLPVVAYNNAEHTDVNLNDGYSEAPGANPYENRDARLYHSIVFNGSEYGKYKGMSGSADDLVIYTYEGKDGTGFNDDPTSQDDSDKRRSCTGYYGDKFRSATYWGGQTGGPNAHKIYFRLVELYLNLAEAECQLGNLPEAISALNVVRTRAGQPVIEDVPGFSNTQEFLLERIRNERRVELCFENHRFYDQRRWQILDETNDAITGMRISSSDGTDNGTFSYERVEVDMPRQATSEQYLILPVPIEEARKLPGIGQPSVWE